MSQLFYKGQWELANMKGAYLKTSGISKLHSQICLPCDPLLTLICCVPLSYKGTSPKLNDWFSAEYIHHLHHCATVVYMQVVCMYQRRIHLYAAGPPESPLALGLTSHVTLPIQRTLSRVSYVCTIRCYKWLLEVSIDISDKMWCLKFPGSSIVSSK